MWNFNNVESVTYCGGYVYHIVFDNGVAGQVDFAGYLDRGPVFAALKDMACFRAARVANGTICWPNGADIAPETLYEQVEMAANRAAATTTSPLIAAEKQQGYDSRTKPKKAQEGLQKCGSDPSV